MIHILMSTYNGEQYLPEQLESIIAQTYTDWHLYVRDDGSSDNTRRIVERYAEADKRITLLPDDGKNMRAMKSFIYLLSNYGDADYVAFADQDDVWLPEKLEICLNVIKSKENLYGQKTPIVVHTDLFVVDSNLNQISPSFWKYSNIRTDLIDTHLQYMAISNSVTGCAMLFNKAATINSLPFPDQAYMHDAWISLKTYVQGGYVIPIPEPTIMYRQHHTNVLGAVRYSVFGRNISTRIEDAKRSYSMSEGLVYNSVISFVFWKIIYIVHRLLTSHRLKNE